MTVTAPTQHPPILTRRITNPARRGRVREEESVYPLAREIREKWCAALRGGRYKAGSFMGRDFHDTAGERWSPLGVLRGALELPWGKVWECGPLSDGPEPKVMVRYCPPERAEWAGWQEIDRAERERFGLDVLLLSTVMAVYVAWEWTFEEIADYLELNTYDPSE